MLNLAKEKGIYDKLIQQDILEYLNSMPKTIKTVLAADVFCYLGDLTPIIKLCKGKTLCFSVENSPKTSDYQISITGRYTHNPLYIEKLLKENGFKTITKQTVTLRKENSKDVEGTIFYAH